MSTTDTVAKIRPPAPPVLDVAPPTARPSRRRAPARRSQRALTVLIGAVLGVGALVTAFPFLWMIASSVKPRSESVAYPPQLLPQEPTFEFFVQLFSELDFGRYLVNTIAVVLIGMVGLLFMAMAGYGFAKFTFRGREPLFFLVLVTMMIPVQVTMIPTYLILNGLQLTNTLVGIALPTLVSGFSVFLFRQFMLTIPTEMLEAARIDGAGEGRIFWRIVLPLSKPILAVQIVLTFIAGWNSFLWPLIITSSEQLRVLPLGLALFVTKNKVVWDIVFAGSVLVTLPVLIMFILFQRQILKAAALSGLK